MKSEVHLRAWRRTDVARLAHLGPRLSPDTARARFWSAYNSVPPTYLRSIEARWPADWNAVVAVRNNEFVGWAEFGRNAHTSPDADLAVCVVDSERGKGTGKALVRALLAASANVGVTTMHADIAADNIAAIRTWQSATRGLESMVAHGSEGLRATVTLPAIGRRAA
jgi:RimJ/RimL family protein N-acetyltransferase